jgi:16S rRNA (guanine(527)-N(7))-methyltransferase RsmG
VADTEQALLDRLACEVHGLRLAPAAVARLGRFLDLLELWNRRLPLTGDRDRRTLVRKHVVDSLACVPLLPDAGSVLDVGTGAGFPGVVLGCVRPDLDVALLDSRERVASFLGEVTRAVPLPRARAVRLRVEDAAEHPDLAGKQALVTSRAIRVDRFLAWAAPLLASNGRALAMQTTHLDRATAEKGGARHGLRVVDLRDYRLPDGEPRRLVLFG